MTTTTTATTNTTTTTATTNTTTTTSATNTKPRRPTILIAAVVLMLLVAVLSLAAPFLPRGGFGGGMAPGGAPPANGQAAGDPGQLPANGQASGRGQLPANGQGFGPGGPGAPGGVLGFGGTQSGGTFSVMSLMQPLRIGEALVGALLALLAALGLWRLRIWGRNLALVVAAACLLSVIAGLIMPLLGRTPWLMVLTGSTWQAIAGFGLALAASILALLPAARRAYVVKPKVRRVI
jgi:hypothetical protein